MSVSPCSIRVDAHFIVQTWDVCARIVPEDLPLLGRITPGRKFSFVLHSKNAGEHGIMKDSDPERANTTPMGVPNADEPPKETREEPAS